MKIYQKKIIIEIEDFQKNIFYARCFLNPVRSRPLCTSYNSSMVFINNEQLVSTIECHSHNSSLVLSNVSPKMSKGLLN